MKTKIFSTLVVLIGTFSALAQPANDNCVSAQVVTIPSSGSTCFNSTNVGATSDMTTNVCDTGLPGNEVWYTFVSTGGANSITITPNGATPASSVVVSMGNNPCGGGVFSACNAATGAAAATTSFSYPVGTQVWFSVETNGTDGTYQVCVSSISQPPAPGNSCVTATRICTKNTFSVTPYPVNSNVITPSCFPSPFQRPIFYQFTVGQSGTCIWSADPNGLAEYDWVMYDITGGCPGTDVCCNFNYASATGAPVGMAAGGPGVCGTQAGNGPTEEFSPPANVVAGNTYLIVIDNYSDNNVGFTMTWGGTFEMAPNPNFTLTPSSGCAPLNVTITNTSTATAIYDWDYGNGNSSATSANSTQTYSAPGSYIVSLVATSASGCTDVQTATITVNPSPVITAVPNQSQCPGAFPAIAFSSNIVGTTYAWTNSNTAIGLGASGTGNLPAFTATNTGSTNLVATITVTPTAAGCAGTPITFTITIKPKPVLTAVTNISQCGGATPAVNFTSTPVGATTSWTNSNTSIGLGASGTGNIASFTGTNSGAAPITGTITVTPTLNSCVGTPINFNITINPTPIISPITNVTACANSTVAATTVTVTPTVTPTWTNSNTAIGLGASGSGNIPSFTAANVATATTGTITLNATSAGCNAVPVTFTYTINPSPTVNAVVNINQCAGSSVPSTTFTSTTAGTTFGWTNSNTTIGLGASGTGALPIFTALNPGSTPNTATITVTPTVGTCVGSPTTFTITVSPTPTMTTPTNISQCGGAVPAINFTTVPAGATTNWTNSNTAIGLGASGSGNIASFTGTNSTAAPISGTITVTPSSGACIGNPVNFTITINPTPVISPISNVTACYNTTVASVPITVTPTTTPSWTNSNTGIGLAASGTGNVPSFTGTNSGGGPISGTITVNASSAGCNATPQTFTITITGGPTMDPVTNITQCANSTIPASNYTSATAGLTYTWTNTNTSIGLAASGSNNTPSFTAINAGTTSQVSTVSVTPALGACIGTPVTYTITINPLPQLLANNNGPVCEGSPLNLTVAGPAGATYNWSGPNSFSAAVQNGTIASPTVAATGIYTVTATLNGCTSSTTTNSVINPTQSATINAAGPFCLNASLQTMTASVAGGTWSGVGITNGITGEFNPSVAGVGTHTITYTLAGACTTPATTTVTVSPLPAVSFSTLNNAGCVPFTTTIVDNSAPLSSSVVWDFGDGTTSTQTGSVTHTFNAVGCFDVTLTSTSASGCTNTQTIANFICAAAYADASFTVPNAQTTLLNPNFTFINNSTNATSYNWSFDDGTTSTSVNPTHSYDATPGSYLVTLVANNANNCPDTASMIIQISEDLIYYVPNTFTPDGDEYNNTFKPIFYSGFDPQEFTLTIFNRWGEILFESKNVEIGWDGTYNGEYCQNGSYVWTIRFKDSRNDKKHTLNGHVNILK
jgi:gliding motility-associated-like protein